MFNLHTMDTLGLTTEAICYMILHSLWQIPVIALAIKLITRHRLSRSTKSSYTANLSALGLSLVAALFTLSFYLVRGFNVAEEVSANPLSNGFDATALSSQLLQSIAFATTESNWIETYGVYIALFWVCLLYTSPSPRDQRGSRMPSSA